MTDLILAAGFDAFPGAPANPTAQLMRELESLGLPWLRTCVLPVEWERAGDVLQARIEAMRPRAVLLFGLHARVERLRIEERAQNARGPDRPDAAGRQAPEGPIDGASPPELFARLPLEPIEARWAAASLGFERSRDAGLYLCNETLFRLCRDAAANGLSHHGFVHVPVTDELGGAFDATARGLTTMPAEALLRAARLALEEVASAPLFDSRLPKAGGTVRRT